MPYKRVRAWPGFGDHVGWVEGQAVGRKGVGRDQDFPFYFEGNREPLRGFEQRRTEFTQSH